jgi:hypothetical protein
MESDNTTRNESADTRSETKRERFLRVAERRTNTVLFRIRVLSNCANKHNYEYDEEDVTKIFDAIDREVKVARSKFETSGRPKFSFRDEA